ncbi:flocculation protein FLO11 [Gossypium australe]|uniref:Flocculation protein FLO11 n=1 Tax=Gossypium australe TaxID=47621 RepID=A0A5B6WR32_9ROSI|nr:flocculation protein FLO11 [Gossypium australe]
MTLVLLLQAYSILIWSDWQVLTHSSPAKSVHEQEDFASQHNRVTLKSYYNARRMNAVGTPPHYASPSLFN